MYDRTLRHAIFQCRMANAALITAREVTGINPDHLLKALDGPYMYCAMQCCFYIDVDSELYTWEEILNGRLA